MKVIIVLPKYWQEKEIVTIFWKRNFNVESWCNKSMLKRLATKLSGTLSSFKKQKKQESPPSWTQEASNPPRSKCSLCYSIDWPRGGGGVTSPEEEYPHPVPMGEGVPHPVLMGWGVPPPVLMGGELPPSSPVGGGGVTPIQSPDRWGTPALTPPHPDLGWKYRPIPTGRMGVLPCQLDGGTPSSWNVNTHTCENSTFPHPSDAGGNRNTYTVTMNLTEM